METLDTTDMKCPVCFAPAGKPCLVLTDDGSKQESAYLHKFRPGNPYEIEVS